MSWCEDVVLCFYEFSCLNWPLTAGSSRTHRHAEITPPHKAAMFDPPRRSKSPKMPHLHHRSWVRVSWRKHTHSISWKRSKTHTHKHILENSCYFHLIMEMRVTLWRVAEDRTWTTSCFRLKTTFDTLTTAPGSLEVWGSCQLCPVGFSAQNKHEEQWVQTKHFIFCTSAESWHDKGS